LTSAALAILYFFGLAALSHSAGHTEFRHVEIES
jgi:hypothetical protein